MSLLLDSPHQLRIAAKPPAKLARKEGPDWGWALGQSARFYWNKALYGFFPALREAVARGRGHGLVKEARVVMREGSARLPYWAIRDIYGVWRGGQPAWIYLQD